MCAHAFFAGTDNLDGHQESREDWSACPLLGYHGAEVWQPMWMGLYVRDR